MSSHKRVTFADCSVLSVGGKWLLINSERWPGSKARYYVPQAAHSSHTQVPVTHRTWPMTNKDRRGCPRKNWSKVAID